VSDRKIRHLDLCSGIGGFALGIAGAGRDVSTVAFCEIEPYCQAVLRKHWPDVPIYDDIKTFPAEEFQDIDILTAGYPCQPFSLAGKRGGTADDRHLWPEVYRIVAAVRPTWCIFENVPGHITMGLDEVLSDLEDEGYSAGTVVLGAVAVDAPHRRQRVWIVANAGRAHGERWPDVCAGNSEPDGQGFADGQQKVSPAQCGSADAADTARKRKEGVGKKELARNSAHNVAHSFCEGLERQSGELDVRGNQPGRQREEEGGPAAESGLRADVADAVSRRGCRGTNRVSGGQRQPEKAVRHGRGRGRQEDGLWLPEPPVGRVAHGIPNRVHRLKGLGNAVVPPLVTQLFTAVCIEEGW